MLYPYFLHLIRFLFFVLCIFASIWMFYAGFSPFKYILSSKARVKTICGKNDVEDPYCMEAKYNKLVLVIIEGWNSINSEYLEYSSIADPLPVFRDLSGKNKLNENKGTTLFMKMDLGNKTSSSVFLKTIMTGNFPGLIDIPKQMYFNNSLSEEKSVLHSNTMDQDNFLLRVQDFGPGKSVLIGKSIHDEGLKNLFNVTDITNKPENANFLNWMFVLN